MAADVRRIQVYMCEQYLLHHRNLCLGLRGEFREEKSVTLGGTLVVCSGTMFLKRPAFWAKAATFRTGRRAAKTGVSRTVLANNITKTLQIKAGSVRNVLST